MSIGSATAFAIRPIDVNVISGMLKTMLNLVIIFWGLNYPGLMISKDSIVELFEIGLLTILITPSTNLLMMLMSPDGLNKFAVTW